MEDKKKTSILGFNICKYIKDISKDDIFIYSKYMDFLGNIFHNPIIVAKQHIMGGVYYTTFQVSVGTKTFTSSLSNLIDRKVPSLYFPPDDSNIDKGYFRFRTEYYSSNTVNTGKSLSDVIYDLMKLTGGAFYKNESGKEVKMPKDLLDLEILKVI